jgi:AraC-like DNA-binding protein
MAESWQEAETHVTQGSIFSELPSRPVAYYATVLDQMGFDARPILRSVNIPARRPRAQGESISTALIFAFIGKAIEGTHLPGLGLWIGQQLKLSDLGILGYTMKSSDTLRDAVTMLSAYHEIAGGFLSPALEENCSRDARLSFHFHVPENEHRYFFMEEMLTCLLALAGELTGEELAYRRVQLDYARPDHFREYEEFLGCPVIFSAPRNEVTIDRAKLDLFCVDRDQETHMECRQVCRRLLCALESSNGVLVGRIEKILRASRGTLARRDEVARQLNMSTRTLSRKLAEMGTSYQAVADKVRFELAETYLQTTSFSLEAISGLVGYSDRSSFLRAFRRWCGKSPSELRPERFKSRVDRNENAKLRVPRQ